MNTVLTSVVAALAALAGSTLTFLFQRHIARQTERFTRSQQLWHERVAAYSAFAAALTDFRRSQNDRWQLQQADPSSSQFIAAREEAYQRRADATAALCRVRLVSSDARVAELGQTGLDLTIEIQEAGDERDRARRGEKARLALDEFLSAASRHVH